MRWLGPAAKPAGRPLVVLMENANVSDEPLGIMGLKYKTAPSPEGRATMTRNSPWLTLFTTMGPQSVRH
jgi:hypothetical protein